MSETELYYEDVELGDEIGPVHREVTDEQVRQFVSVGGAERGPSRFTSAEVADSEGLPNTIVPGAMNIAIMSQLITGWSSTVALRKLDVVFRQMVFHEIPLRLVGVITDKNELDGENQVECDIYLETTDGDRLVGGKATAVLPSKQ